MGFFFFNLQYRVTLHSILYKVQCYLSGNRTPYRKKHPHLQQITMPYIECDSHQKWLEVTVINDSKRCTYSECPVHDSTYLMRSQIRTMASVLLWNGLLSFRYIVINAYMSWNTPTCRWHRYEPNKLNLSLSLFLSFFSQDGRPSAKHAVIVWKMIEGADISCSNI